MTKPEQRRCKDCKVWKQEEQRIRKKGVTFDIMAICCPKMNDIYVNKMSFCKQGEWE